MRDEENMEAEIQAKGLTAPRLTPTLIDKKITSAAYYVFPGTTLTICALTLANGFQVTGESAAASPENFNEEIFRKIAYENARNKIWMLEGYLLRERLASGFADPALIDRGTLGAASFALDKFCTGDEAINTRAELRRAAYGTDRGEASATNQSLSNAVDHMAPTRGAAREIVTRDVGQNCWRNSKGDAVPDSEVIRSGDFHIRIVPDTELGQVAGKLIGHDRSEEGAPSFKG